MSLEVAVTADYSDTLTTNSLFLCVEAFKILLLECANAQLHALYI